MLFAPPVLVPPPVAGTVVGVLPAGVVAKVVGVGAAVVVGAGAGAAEPGRH